MRRPEEDDFAFDERLYWERMLPRARALLPRKRLFAIDLFDTFLTPRGFDAQHPDPALMRAGFVVFLEHYADKIKIGITDALHAREVDACFQTLGIRNHFAAVYGKETSVESRVQEWGKDFAAVAAAHGVSLDDMVVIGDGASEARLCTWYHIDLIRLPPMEWFRPLEFSFERLIFPANSA